LPTSWRTPSIANSPKPSILRATAKPPPFSARRSRALSTSTTALPLRRRPAPTTPVCGWRSISNGPRRNLTSVYGILADNALADVVRTALGFHRNWRLQTSTSRPTCSSRASTSRISRIPETWQVPDRFTALWELQNPSFGSVDSSLAAWFVVRLRHHAGADALNQQSQAWRPLMQGSLYVSLSSQIALERRMNTLADNVANANTTGFRATEIKFNEVLATLDRPMSHSSTRARISCPPPMGASTTGSQLDFAIRGDAWFMVETPTGNMLTRDGRFTHDPGRRAGQHRRLSGARSRVSARFSSIPTGDPPKAGRDGGLTQDGARRRDRHVTRPTCRRRIYRQGSLGIVPTVPPEPVVDKPAPACCRAISRIPTSIHVMEMSKLIMVSRAFETPRR
jgi:flagellar basal-body rod protein FlgF